MSILKWGPVELDNIVNFSVEEVLQNSPIILIDGSIYLRTTNKKYRRIRVEGVTHGKSDINLIRSYIDGEYELILAYNSYGWSIITNFSWSVWKYKGLDIWYKYIIEFTTKE